MFANTYILSFTVYSGVLLFSARHLANIINVRLRTVHSRDRHSIYRARARYLFQWIWLDTVHTNTRTVHITVLRKNARLVGRLGSRPGLGIG